MGGCVAFVFGQCDDSCSSSIVLAGCRVRSVGRCCGVALRCGLLCGAGTLGEGSGTSGGVGCDRSVSSSWNSGGLVVSKVEELLERLEEQLQAKDEEIWKLREKVEMLQTWRDADPTYWADHRDAEDLGLPVPRLQIELKIVSPSEYRWFYSLVYRHTTLKLMMVPMGETISRGGHRHFKVENVEDAQRELPFRNGVHIRRDSAHLNLPAYAIIEGQFYELEPIPG